MSFSWGRVGAIFRKELRDYRRNRFVILTMAFFPLLFVVLPTIQLLLVNASTSSARLDAYIGLSLLYMLMIPAPTWNLEPAPGATPGSHGCPPTGNGHPERQHRP